MTFAAKIRRAMKSRTWSEMSTGNTQIRSDNNSDAGPDVSPDLVEVNQDVTPL
jgi:hypothetical protein